MSENETGASSRSSRPEPVLQAGARFGKYEIVRPIGTGGMGAVYEATHLDLHKRVALKVLHKHVAELPEVRTRFMREGQASIRIRHPHVVDVSDVGERDGMPYLVMEFLEGEDLASLIHEKNGLPVDTTLSIALPVVSAVAAAHDASIIHRDLKPENVFLCKTRGSGFSPKLLDFGISKVTNDPTSLGLTGTGMLLGTPYYMPPEQARGGKNVDARSDQYALGIVLYECLVGKRPFVADTLFELLQQIVDGQYQHLRELRPDVPAGLAAVIERAMHKTAAERFPDVRSLGNALLPFASAQAQAVWAHEFNELSEGSLSSTFVSDSRRGPSIPAPAPSVPPPASTSAPPSAAPGMSGTFQPSVRDVGAAPRRPTLLWAAIAAALLLGATGIWWARGHSAGPAPSAAVHVGSPTAAPVPQVSNPAPPVTPAPVVQSAPVPVPTPSLHAVAPPTPVVASPPVAETPAPSTPPTARVAPPHSGHAPRPATGGGNAPTMQHGANGAPIVP